MTGRSSRSTSLLQLLALAPLALAASGCGVIFGYGEPQPVEVVTHPKGALVIVNGVEGKERTPCAVKLHPKQDHSVGATLEGHSSASRSITKKIRTDVVILDAVLTLGIGLIVDYLSGSIYQLESSVTLNLGKAPVDGPAPDPKPNGTKPPKPDGGPTECPYCGTSYGGKDKCPGCGVERKKN